MRTVEETALLLSLILKRSEQTRARISESTIRKVAGRRHLRGAFVNMLKDQLDILGLSMSELDRGGYGLIRASILEGASSDGQEAYRRRSGQAPTREAGL